MAENQDKGNTSGIDPFYNPALVGAGSILPEGGYGPPTEDPNKDTDPLVIVGPRTTRAGRPVPADVEAAESKAPGKTGRAGTSTSK